MHTIQAVDYEKISGGGCGANCYPATSTPVYPHGSNNSGAVLSSVADHALQGAIYGAAGSRTAQGAIAGAIAGAAIGLAKSGGN